jgi:hypothetical protein
MAGGENHLPTEKRHQSERYWMTYYDNRSQKEPPNKPASLTNP